MACGCNNRNMDHGPGPYVLNVSQAAARNEYFRAAVWTGHFMQMTIMNIPVKGDIGWEKHTDTDQMIRIEQGKALVQMGSCSGKAEMESVLGCGEAVFVPVGMWHNVVNIAAMPLKVSSIYAPPHHPKGTVHMTKKDVGEH